MFTLRIVNVDHYLSSPVVDLDPSYSSFRGSPVSRVPIVRIFGATPAGQKCCLHVHGAFPYIIVPYDGSEALGVLPYMLASSLDKALNIASGHSESNIQHVFNIIPVSGIPFYGYHAKEHIYLKIYLYNPLMVRKAAELLQNGAVLGRSFQPHESHVPYTLQFMMDNNLHGMNFIHLNSYKFRKVPDTEMSSVEDFHRVCSEDSLRQPNRTNASTKIWSQKSVPKDAWLPDSIEGMSTCELEVDTCVDCILNNQMMEDGVASNPGLHYIWEDEKERQKKFGYSQCNLLPPSSPERTLAETSESELKFRNLLKAKLLLSAKSSPGVSLANVSLPVEAPDSMCLLNATAPLGSWKSSQVCKKEDQSLPVKSNEADITVDESIIYFMSQKASSSLCLDSQDEELISVIGKLADGSQLESPEDRDAILSSKNPTGSQDAQNTSDSENDDNETMLMTQPVSYPVDIAEAFIEPRESEPRISQLDGSPDLSLLHNAMVLDEDKSYNFLPLTCKTASSIKCSYQVQDSSSDCSIDSQFDWFQYKTIPQFDGAGDMKESSSSKKKSRKDRERKSNKEGRESKSHKYVPASHGEADNFSHRSSKYVQYPDRSSSSDREQHRHKSKNHRLSSPHFSHYSSQEKLDRHATSSSKARTEPRKKRSKKHKKSKKSIFDSEDELTPSTYSDGNESRSSRRKDKHGKSNKDIPHKLTFPNNDSFSDLDKMPHFEMPNIRSVDDPFMFPPPTPRCVIPSDEYSGIKKKAPSSLHLEDLDSLPMFEMPPTPGFQLGVNDPPISSTSMGKASCKSIATDNENQALKYINLFGPQSPCQSHIGFLNMPRTPGKEFRDDDIRYEPEVPTSNLSTNFLDKEVDCSNLNILIKRPPTPGAVINFEDSCYLSQSTDQPSQNLSEPLSHSRETLASPVKLKDPRLPIREEMRWGAARREPMQLRLPPFAKQALKFKNKVQSSSSSRPGMLPLNKSCPPNRNTELSPRNMQENAKIPVNKELQTNKKFKEKSVANKLKPISPNTKKQIPNHPRISALDRISTEISTTTANMLRRTPPVDDFEDVRSSHKSKHSHNFNDNIFSMANQMPRMFSPMAPTPRKEQPDDFSLMLHRKMASPMAQTPASRRDSEKSTVDEYVATFLGNKLPQISPIASTPAHISESRKFSVDEATLLLDSVDKKTDVMFVAPAPISPMHLTRRRNSSVDSIGKISEGMQRNPTENEAAVRSLLSLSSNYSNLDPAMSPLAPTPIRQTDYGFVATPTGTDSYSITAAPLPIDSPVPASQSVSSIFSTPTHVITPEINVSKDHERAMFDSGFDHQIQRNESTDEEDIITKMSKAETDKAIQTICGEDNYHGLSLSCSEPENELDPVDFMEDKLSESMEEETKRATMLLNEALMSTNPPVCVKSILSTPESSPVRPAVPDSSEMNAINNHEPTNNISLFFSHENSPDLASKSNITESTQPSGSPDPLQRLCESTIGLGDAATDLENIIMDAPIIVSTPSQCEASKSSLIENSDLLSMCTTVEPKLAEAEQSSIGHQSQRSSEPSRSCHSQTMSPYEMCGQSETGTSSTGYRVTPHSFDMNDLNLSSVDSTANMSPAVASSVINVTTNSGILVSTPAMNFTINSPNLPPNSSNASIQQYAETSLHMNSCPAQVYTSVANFPKSTSSSQNVGGFPSMLTHSLDNSSAISNGSSCLTSCVSSYSVSKLANKGLSVAPAVHYSTPSTLNMTSTSIIPPLVNQVSDICSISNLPIATAVQTNARVLNTNSQQFCSNPSLWVQNSLPVPSILSTHNPPPQSSVQTCNNSLIINPGHMLPVYHTATESTGGSTVPTTVNFVTRTMLPDSMLNVLPTPDSHMSTVAQTSSMSNLNTVSKLLFPNLVGQKLNTVQSSVPNQLEHLVQKTIHPMSTNPLNDIVPCSTSSNNFAAVKLTYPNVGSNYSDNLVSTQPGSLPANVGMARSGHKRDFQPTKNMFDGFQQNNPTSNYYTSAPPSDTYTASTAHASNVKADLPNVSFAGSSVGTYNATMKNIGNSPYLTSPVVFTSSCSPHISTANTKSIITSHSASSNLNNRYDSSYSSKLTDCQLKSVDNLVVPSTLNESSTIYPSKSLDKTATSTAQMTLEEMLANPHFGIPEQPTPVTNLRASCLKEMPAKNNQMSFRNPVNSYHSTPNSQVSPGKKYFSEQMSNVNLIRSSHLDKNMNLHGETQNRRQVSSPARSDKKSYHNSVQSSPNTAAASKLKSLLEGSGDVPFYLNTDMRPLVSESLQHSASYYKNSILHVDKNMAQQLPPNGNRMLTVQPQSSPNFRMRAKLATEGISPNQQMVPKNSHGQSISPRTIVHGSSGRISSESFPLFPQLNSNYVELPNISPLASNKQSKVHEMSRGRINDTNPSSCQFSDNTCQNTNSSSAPTRLSPFNEAHSELEQEAKLMGNLADSLSHVSKELTFDNSVSNQHYQTPLNSNISHFNSLTDNSKKNWSLTKEKPNSFSGGEVKTHGAAGFPSFEYSGDLTITRRPGVITNAEGTHGFSTPNRNAAPPLDTPNLNTDFIAPPLASPFSYGIMSQNLSRSSSSSQSPQIGSSGSQNSLLQRKVLHTPRHISGHVGLPIPSSLSSRNPQMSPRQSQMHASTVFESSQPNVGSGSCGMNVLPYSPVIDRDSHSVDSYSSLSQEQMRPLPNQSAYKPYDTKLATPEGHVRVISESPHFGLDCVEQASPVPIARPKIVRNVPTTSPCETQTSPLSLVQHSRVDPVIDSLTSSTGQALIPSHLPSPSMPISIDRFTQDYRPIRKRTVPLMSGPLTDPMRMNINNSTINRSVMNQMEASIPNETLASPRDRDFCRSAGPPVVRDPVTVLSHPVNYELKPSDKLNLMNIKPAGSFHKVLPVRKNSAYELGSGRINYSEDFDHLSLLRYPSESLNSPQNNHTKFTANSYPFQSSLPLDLGSLYPSTDLLAQTMALPCPPNTSHVKNSNQPGRAFNSDIGNSHTAISDESDSPINVVDDSPQSDLKKAPSNTTPDPEPARISLDVPPKSLGYQLSSGNLPQSPKSYKVRENMLINTNQPQLESANNSTQNADVNRSNSGEQLESSYFEGQENYGKIQKYLTRVQRNSVDHIRSDVATPSATLEETPSFDPFSSEHHTLLTSLDSSNPPKTSLVTLNSTSMTNVLPVSSDTEKNTLPHMTIAPVNRFDKSSDSSSVRSTSTDTVVCSSVGQPSVFSNDLVTTKKIQRRGKRMSLFSQVHYQANNDDKQISLEKNLAISTPKPHGVIASNFDVQSNMESTVVGKPTENESNPLDHLDSDADSPNHLSVSLIAGRHSSTSSECNDDNHFESEFISNSDGLNSGERFGTRLHIDKENCLTSDENALFVSSLLQNFPSVNQEDISENVHKNKSVHREEDHQASYQKSPAAQIENNGTEKINVDESASKHASSDSMNKSSRINMVSPQNVPLNFSEADVRRSSTSSDSNPTDQSNLTLKLNFKQHFHPEDSNGSQNRPPMLTKAYRKAFPDNLLTSTPMKTTKSKRGRPRKNPKDVVKKPTVRKPKSTENSSNKPNPTPPVVLMENNSRPSRQTRAGSRKSYAEFFSQEEKSDNLSRSNATLIQNIPLVVSEEKIEGDTVKGPITCSKKAKKNPVSEIKDKLTSPVSNMNQEMVKLPMEPATKEKETEAIPELFASTEHKIVKKADLKFTIKKSLINHFSNKPTDSIPNVNSDPVVPLPQFASSNDPLGINSQSADSRKGSKQTEAKLDKKVKNIVPKIAKGVTKKNKKVMTKIRPQDMNFNLYTPVHRVNYNGPGTTPASIDENNILKITLRKKDVDSAAQNQTTGRLSQSSASVNDGLKQIFSNTKKDSSANETSISSNEEVFRKPQLPRILIKKSSNTYQIAEKKSQSKEADEHQKRDVLVRSQPVKRTLPSRKIKEKETSLVEQPVKRRLPLKKTMKSCIFTDEVLTQDCVDRQNESGAKHLEASDSPACRMKSDSVENELAVLLGSPLKNGEQQTKDKCMDDDELTAILKGGKSERLSQSPKEMDQNVPLDLSISSVHGDKKLATPTKVILSSLSNEDIKKFKGSSPVPSKGDKITSPVVDNKKKRPITPECGKNKRTRRATDSVSVDDLEDMCVLERLCSSTRKGKRRSPRDAAGNRKRKLKTDACELINVSNSKKRKIKTDLCETLNHASNPKKNLIKKYIKSQNMQEEMHLKDVQDTTAFELDASNNLNPSPAISITGIQPSKNVAKPAPRKHKTQNAHLKKIQRVISPTYISDSMVTDHSLIKAAGALDGEPVNMVDNFELAGDSPTKSKPKVGGRSFVIFRSRGAKVETNVMDNNCVQQSSNTATTVDQKMLLANKETIGGNDQILTETSQAAKDSPAVAVSVGVTVKQSAISLELSDNKDSGGNEVYDFKEISESKVMHNNKLLGISKSGKAPSLVTENKPQTNPVTEIDDDVLNKNGSNLGVCLDNDSVGHFAKQSKKIKKISISKKKVARSSKKKTKPLQNPKKTKLHCVKSKRFTRASANFQSVKSNEIEAKISAENSTVTAYNDKTKRSEDKNGNIMEAIDNSNETASNIDISAPEKSYETDKNPKSKNNDVAVDTVKTSNKKNLSKVELCPPLEKNHNVTPGKSSDVGKVISKTDKLLSTTLVSDEIKNIATETDIKEMVKNETPFTDEENIPESSCLGITSSSSISTNLEVSFLDKLSDDSSKQSLVAPSPDSTTVCITASETCSVSSDLNNVYPSCIETNGKVVSKSQENIENSDKVKEASLPRSSVTIDKESNDVLENDTVGELFVLLNKDSPKSNSEITKVPSLNTKVFNKIEMEAANKVAELPKKDELSGPLTLETVNILNQLQSTSIQNSEVSSLTSEKSIISIEATLKPISRDRETTTLPQVELGEDISCRKSMLEAKQKVASVEKNEICSPCGDSEKNTTDVTRKSNQDLVLSSLIKINESDSEKCVMKEAVDQTENSFIAKESITEAKKLPCVSDALEVNSTSNIDKSIKNLVQGISLNNNHPTPDKPTDLSQAEKYDLENSLASSTVDTSKVLPLDSKKYSSKSDAESAKSQSHLMCVAMNSSDHKFGSSTDLESSAEVCDKEIVTCMSSPKASSISPLCKEVSSPRKSFSEAAEQLSSAEANCSKLHDHTADSIGASLKLIGPENSSSDAKEHIFSSSKSIQQASDPQKNILGAEKQSLSSHSSTFKIKENYGNYSEDTEPSSSKPKCTHGSSLKPKKEHKSSSRSKQGHRSSPKSRERSSNSDLSSPNHNHDRKISSKSREQSSSDLSSSKNKHDHRSSSKSREQSSSSDLSSSKNKHDHRNSSKSREKSSSSDLSTSKTKHDHRSSSKSKEQSSSSDLITSNPKHDSRSSSKSREQSSSSNLNSSKTKHDHRNSSKSREQSFSSDLSLSNPKHDGKSYSKSREQSASSDLNSSKTKHDHRSSSKSREQSSSSDLSLSNPKDDGKSYSKSREESSSSVLNTSKTKHDHRSSSKSREQSSSSDINSSKTKHDHGSSSKSRVQSSSSDLSLSNPKHDRRSSSKSREQPSSSDLSSSNSKQHHKNSANSMEQSSSSDLTTLKCKQGHRSSSKVREQSSNSDLTTLKCKQSHRSSSKVREQSSNSDSSPRSKKDKNSLKSSEQLFRPDISDKTKKSHKSSHESSSVNTLQSHIPKSYSSPKNVKYSSSSHKSSSKGKEPLPTSLKSKDQSCDSNKNLSKSITKPSSYHKKSPEIKEQSSDSNRSPKNSREQSPKCILKSNRQIDSVTKGSKAEFLTSSNNNTSLSKELTNSDKMVSKTDIRSSAIKCDHDICKKNLLDKKSMSSGKAMKAGELEEIGETGHELCQFSKLTSGDVDSSLKLCAGKSKNLLLSSQEVHKSSQLTDVLTEKHANVKKTISQLAGANTSVEHLKSTTKLNKETIKVKTDKTLSNSMPNVLTKSENNSGKNRDFEEEYIPYSSALTKIASKLPTSKLKTIASLEDEEYRPTPTSSSKVCAEAYIPTKITETKKLVAASLPVETYIPTVVKGKGNIVTKYVPKESHQKEYSKYAGKKPRNDKITKDTSCVKSNEKGCVATENPPLTQKDSERKILKYKLCPPAWKEIVQSNETREDTEPSLTVPFCSVKEDVPVKPMEVGNKTLQVKTNFVKDLSECRGTHHDSGILFWMETLTENVSEVSRGPSKILTPLSTPPSLSDVSTWIKAKEFLEKTDKVKLHVSSDESGKTTDTSTPHPLKDQIQQTSTPLVLPFQESHDMTGYRKKHFEPSSKKKLQLSPIGSKSAVHQSQGRGKVKHDSLTEEDIQDIFGDVSKDTIIESSQPSMFLNSYTIKKCKINEHEQSVPNMSIQRQQINSHFRDQLLTQAPCHRSFSQNIAGVSSEATFAFKFSDQNLAEAKALQEHEYLTSMYLECVTTVQPNLVSNPSTDSILALIFLIHQDYPETDRCPSRIQGSIIWGPGEHGLPQRDDRPILYVADELELLDEFCKLVQLWDPDLFIGYEVQMMSWGYLLERGSALHLDLASRLSRIPNDTSVHFDENLDEYGYAHTHQIHLPGRIILNVWRLMRAEVTLQSYTMENVAFHVLHIRIPTYAPANLSDWWQTARYRWRTFNYYMRRCEVCLQLCEKLDLITRTAELARLFGIQFYEVLSRGSQHRVESMMLRLSRTSNMVALSPSVEQRAGMVSPEWLPLNMEPLSQYYTDPVVVLDFQSLYPSIMIAYNYCFSTCLGKVSSLGTDNPFKFGAGHLKISAEQLVSIVDELNISPCGVAFMPKRIRQGILPTMLEEILNTRIMVKKAMKQHKEDSSLQRVLFSRQLGLKLIANVTYGYTSANFSGRMPCVEVADSVVSKGRETLERAISLVHSSPEWKAKVVYGDTDSIFLHFPGSSKERAFRVGQQIANVITQRNPKPIKLKFEKVYMPCILQTKKRYVGYMYESPEQREPIFDAKGIETVRRDGCPAVSKILEKSLRILFDSANISSVKEYVQRQMVKLLQGKVSLDDLIFAKEFRGLKGYRLGACVPALELARQWCKIDPRREPRVGERVPYVIIYGAPGLPLIRLVCSPSRFMQDTSLKINNQYYACKAVLPPLQRCFSLLGIDVFSWYTDIPRVHSSNLTLENIKSGPCNTIPRFFASLTCTSCGERANQASGIIPLCPKCISDPQKTVLALSENMRTYDRVVEDISKICTTCMGTPLEKVDCISLDCPITFRLSKAIHKRQLVPKIKEVIENNF